MSREKINYIAENLPVLSFHFTNKYHRSMITRNIRIDGPQPILLGRKTCCFIPGDKALIFLICSNVCIDSI